MSAHALFYISDCEVARSSQPWGTLLDKPRSLDTAQAAFSTVLVSQQQTSIVFFFERLSCRSDDVDDVSCDEACFFVVTETQNCK